MERYEAQSIGDLLRQEIENNQKAYRFDEINAIKAWPAVIGEAIASKTRQPMIRNGVMTILVPAAPLRQELNMMRSALAKAINAAIGKEIVKEIQFR